MTDRGTRTAVFLLLCLGACALSMRMPLQGQVRVHYPDRAYSSISAGSAQWIGSPRGLYRYRFDDNVWAAYGPQNGLRSARITALEQRNDVLWIGQQGAVSSFDLRSNTMLHFDSSSGLPLRDIRSIAFEGEYTWAGGRGGAARYDELIEEWQYIGAEQGLRGTVVHAMLQGDGRMFFATDAGVEEYDPRYERWRYYPLPPELRVIDAFATDRWLWLLHDGGLQRFDPSARNFAPLAFQDFRGGDVGVVLIDGDNFWLRTPNDLWRYDDAADALRPFLEWERLPDRDLRDVAVSASGGMLWFRTAAGVTAYRPADGYTLYYTEAGGMPAMDYDAMFLLGNGVAAFADENIAYLRADENRWYTVPLLKSGSGSGAQLSLDPAEGSFVDFGGDWRLDLSGSRSAWLFEDPFGTDELVFGREDPLSRNDLKARLELGGGRRISALYNDADFEDVTYGAEYRGARDDVLQSLQWGDIRREQGQSLLGQSMGIFGVGGRAVYGARSERYGRSPVEISAVTGHKTTARHTEVFHGRFERESHSVTDAEWTPQTWFYLRADRSEQTLTADRVQLYRERMPGEDAYPDDLLQTAIAGMTADWRPLEEGLDYSVDRQRSLLEVHGEIMPVARAVRIVSGGQVTELLLSDGADNHVLEVRNRYRVGNSILPSSFSLRITAPDGSAAPLTQFGIDADGDGRVDPDFIDYATGTLRFPDPEPFPAGAYQSPAQVTYTMQVAYESFSASYWLAKRRIIRGSERILVDGLPVNAGEDYILDYTSGILVFTRDGVVLDDSRVEISYEYVRNAADERITQATLTVSPSDFTQAAVTGGSFHEDHSSVATHFVQGAGELRWQSDALDFRLQPEYRHTWSDSAQGDAAALSATLSTPAARLALRSALRSDGYHEPATPAYAGGRLRDDHALQGEYDISSELRAFANWRQRSGYDTLRRDDLEDRAMGGGLQWVRQDWPSLTLRGDLLDERDAYGERSRGGMRADVAWIPSAELLENAGFSSARFTGYARYGQETLTPSDALPDAALTGERRYRNQNYFLRSVFSPRPLFTVNAWYQGDARAREDAAGSMRPDYQRDRVFVDLLMEHIRGLSLGGRLTADERQLWKSRDRYDLYTSTVMQLNLRLAPGTWVPLLQPFTLYVSLQRNIGRSISDATRENGLFAALFSAAEGDLHSENAGTYWESRLEWRPMAELLYSLTARSRMSSYERYDVITEGSWREIIQRVDWRPDGFSLYGAQFQYRTDGDREESRRYMPQLWAERRFSRHLLARLMLSTSWTHAEYPWGAFRGWDIDPSGYIMLSFDELPVLRRLELRLDAGYGYAFRESLPILTASTRVSTASLYNKFYLDLYPHPVLFIRFRYFLRWRDPGSALNNYRILGVDGWEQPDAQLQLIMQL